jgi:hypothetical protein
LGVLIRQNGLPGETLRFHIPTEETGMWLSQPPSGRGSIHPGKLALFVALSLADLWLTSRLVEGSECEVNPVAAALLDAYGWEGLTVFKVLVVAATAALCVSISACRPRTGGRVLTFGCLSTGLTVFYSCFMLATS